MLRSRPVSALLAVALLASLVVPASAGASPSDVIRDCLDYGRLTRTYSAKELQQALEQLPADAAEYYNCQDLIAQAQSGLPRGAGGTGSANGAGGANGQASPGAPGAGGSGGPPGGSAGTLGGAAPSASGPAGSLAPASPAEAAAVARARRTGQVAPPTPGDTDSATRAALAPASVFSPGSTRRDVPRPLTAMLCLLALAALGMTGWTQRQRLARVLSRRAR